MVYVVYVDFQKSLTVAASYTMPTQFVFAALVTLCFSIFF